MSLAYGEWYFINTCDRYPIKGDAIKKLLRELEKEADLLEANYLGMDFNKFDYERAMDCKCRLYQIPGTDIDRAGSDFYNVLNPVCGVMGVESDLSSLNSKNISMFGERLYLNENVYDNLEHYIKKFLEKHVTRRIKTGYFIELSDKKMDTKGFWNKVFYSLK